VGISITFNQHCIFFWFFFGILHSDAEDAIHERDGYNYDGYTLRVERPRGLSGGGGRGGSYRGGGGYRGRDSYGSRGRQSGPGSTTRRSDHRIIISGMLARIMSATCYLHFSLNHSSNSLDTLSNAFLRSTKAELELI